MARSRLFELSILALAGSLVACASGNPAGECTNECASLNSLRCAGSLIETCVETGDGCLTWVGTSDCGLTGQTCIETGVTPTCGDTCVDTCTPAGATQCGGSVIQSCTVAATGCLAWVDGHDCSTTGQLCDDSGPNAACMGTCTDQCSTAGVTQCSGTVIQTCAVGTDGCLVWSDDTDCASTGEYCDDAGGSAVCVGSCVDQCPTAGDTQCNGTVIETCGQGPSGCLEWAAGTDCASTGEICSNLGGTASCIPDCPTMPSLPTNPVPLNGATGVDWTTVTSVDWSDSTNASSYAVYLGTACPPPAYPDPAFTPVTVSERTGLALTEGADYCWQVVAISNPTCYRPGPVWTFRTACNDPTPGAPTVTSSVTASYAAGTTSGTYTLTFSEAVSNVAANLTWAPVVGSGTMTVTQTDPQTYAINFSGVADGDQYTLTVGVGVTDVCSIPMTAPVTVNFDVGVGPGQTCADPLDVTGSTFPHQASGTFDDDTGVGGSCDTTPNNIVWFTYTAPTTEWYDIALQNNTATTAFSRLAIFETAACNPHGAELTCVVTSNKTASTSVALTQGTTYLIAFYTDGNSYTMVNPTIDISASSFDPGTVCADPVDVTAGPMPVQVSGTFDQDPATGGSCDTTPTNAVWFSYTAPTTDVYRVNVQNHSTSSAYSRLAVFEGSSCAPLGTELECLAVSSKTATTSLSLTQGTTYLILFHTDGNSFSMVDPEISVALYDQGMLCTTAMDVTAGPFPYQLNGTFDQDPSQGGTCDTSPTNAVWFQYTAPTTDIYDITAVNNTLTGAYSRLAVFQGSGCNPFGPQLECITPSSKTASTTLSLTGGQTYLILFHTDGNSYSMVNPELDIVAVSMDPGQICSAPADVSSASFPYQLSGTFDHDPSQGGTCDTSPTNVVWFSYTPTATGMYNLVAQNHTSSAAYSRLAVFESTSCSPYGAELDCVIASSKTADTTVPLSAGTSYLIMFYTDGSGYSMINPEISVSLITYDPGEVCTESVDVSSVTFPYQLTGTFDEDPSTGGSCDSSPNNAVWFQYTPAVTASYQIDVQNHTSSGAYSRLAVFEGSSCAPLGTELDCSISYSKTVSMNLTMTAGTPYQILFYTDGETYTMVDPEITIQ